jgi:hypothetical protein
MSAAPRLAFELAYEDPKCLVCYFVRQWRKAKMMWDPAASAAFSERSCAQSLHALFV